MTIAVVVIGDGRDQYLRQCIGSLGQLHGPVSEQWLYDDSGDDEYRQTLAARYRGWKHIDGGPRQGCAGAFQQVWQQVAAGTRAKYVFLIEGDFRFVRSIDLNSMMRLLDNRPYLAEVALLRQPWNSEEQRAGGIVEWHPDWYVDMEDKRGRKWLEHRSFTTNPCLFRRSLLDVPWPDSRPGSYSEGIFSHNIHENGTPEVPGEQVRCAYWGARGSGIWVEHIGYQRIGKGY